MPATKDDYVEAVLGMDGAEKVTVVIASALLTFALAIIVLIGINASATRHTEIKEFRSCVAVQPVLECNRALSR